MGQNLRERVQARNGTGDTAGGEVEHVSLRDQIAAMEPHFAMAMPKGAEATQLVRDALTALRTTKDLDKCDAMSVLGGLMSCAQLGLRPAIPGLGHAWVLPFWDGRSRGFRAQLVIGYQGYRELAQRSGQVATLIGRPVHENDVFDVEYGLADNLIHKPLLRGDRGTITDYYTIVKYISGGYAFWHMSKKDAENWRDRYAMAKKRDTGEIVGPWRDNFDEMALKTCFLRLAKWMPKSAEMAAAIAADGTVRVDLSTNLDALHHGQRPADGTAVDGEIVDETPESPSQEPGQE